ncbi:MAG: phosphodiester glycosidase family protein [Streptosporangiaceae bacterium]
MTSARNYPPGQPGRDGRGSKLRRRRNWLPHLPRRRWSRLTAAIVIAFMIPVCWSVGNALTVPGGGTFSERLAEWARSHYLGPVVTFGEWLTYSPPKAGGKPAFALGGPSAAALQKADHAKHGKVVSYAPPPRLKSFAGRPLPNEGIWRVLATVNGKPAIYGTELRASRVYSSYVSGIVDMNQALVKFYLHPGAEDPGPGNWKSLPYIPPGARRGLLATFNGGFRINVSGGGFYLNGATFGTLTAGTASIVYYCDGRLKIGVWDKNVRMTKQVCGVRQNLHLIVSHGNVPSSVDSNVTTAWGATLGGGYYVWRSGIGITKDGHVIFVYGPELNVRELAELLKRAGAVTAMQLDINPDWMSFMYYLHDESARPRPVNLLPNQLQPPTRYYSPTNRDFTAVYAR